ncbi:hypothetical protein HNP55_004295 [Paucibacter oligotrophus]|uniref:Uncharacterized protein n=1 Tax=Roseateles oligotrophus TaxID=1769250 RepID=A0A840LGJ8_9BURK|nr:hypothetical protein [Roseateles oligotrophus]MBB4845743.1 hypothetical protein [Roseateles oligotrophus]
MNSARRVARHWGRWIISGLVAALLFMQLAVAAYACPKLDGPAQAVAMLGAGTAMAAMPDCQAMPGGMDEASPQLCLAHCSADSQAAPSAQALDFHTPAEQLLWLAYVLPAAFEGAALAERREASTASASPPGFPALYLTLQVLRN